MLKKGIFWYIFYCKFNVRFGVDTASLKTNTDQCRPQTNVCRLRWLKRLSPVTVLVQLLYTQHGGTAVQHDCSRRCKWGTWGCFSVPKLLLTWPTGLSHSNIFMVPCRKDGNPKCWPWELECLFSLYNIIFIWRPQAHFSVSQMRNRIQLEIAAKYFCYNEAEEKVRRLKISSTDVICPFVVHRWCCYGADWDKKDKAEAASAWSHNCFSTRKTPFIYDRKRTQATRKKQLHQTVPSFVVVFLSFSHVGQTNWSCKGQIAQTKSVKTFGTLFGTGTPWNDNDPKKFE